MADIPGNHIALEACVERARKHGAEEFLFLGDYLGELAFPEKTIDLLEQIGKEFPCTFIRGNKENYWINRRKGMDPNWVWEAGSSSTGILQYVYARLDDSRIRWFEQMPIAKVMTYPGLPALVICHGSPWKVNESMREDDSYIDELTRKLETELTVCGHFHIQSRYMRNGHIVINPGAAGIPLRSDGKAQFMMLSGIDGRTILLSANLKTWIMNCFHGSGTLILLLKKEKQAMILPEGDMAAQFENPWNRSFRGNSLQKL